MVVSFPVLAFWCLGFLLLVSFSSSCVLFIGSPAHLLPFFGPLLPLEEHEATTKC